MDAIEKIQQEQVIEAKIQRRIKANRIVGSMRFRDHFGSSPGRMTWDLCGHPLYWWKLKAAMDSKYMEKIIVYTEVDEALETAKKMSDKFVPMKRNIEECREPIWKIVDDLKTPNSRVNIISSQGTGKNENQTIERDKKIGFVPSLYVGLSPCHPLETTENLDKMIEKYYEDDLAETACMVSEIPPFLCTKDPNNSQYLLPVWHFSNLVRRQQYPILYRLSGSRIVSYEQPSQGQRMAFIEIPEEEGIEVHSEKDLKLAKFYLKARLNASGTSG